MFLKTQQKSVLLICTAYTVSLLFKSDRLVSQPRVLVLSPGASRPRVTPGVTGANCLSDKRYLGTSQAGVSGRDGK